jgi:HlyD family secretion protein
MGNIDEAEVSKMRPGQSAIFTVQSYPGRTFAATVAEVRLNATVSSDVVIYQAVFQVANPDLLLRPGMTAALKVKTGEADDVLRVPNAALKLRPSREVFAALHEPFPDAVRMVGGIEGLDDPGASKVESAATGVTTRPAGSIVDGLFAPRPRTSIAGQVWIYESGQLKRVPVMLGISDGTWTELEGTTLKAGEAVATGIALTTINPGFMVR